MTAPALLVAIPLLLGALAGATVPGAWPYAAAALVAAWLACGLCLWRTAGTTTVVSALAGCAAAGVLLGAHALTTASHPSLLAWYERGARERAAHLDGVLREDAARTANGLSLTLDVQHADGTRVNGGVRLSIAGALALDAAHAWRAGRTLAIDAQLREPLDYRDPGVPSDRERLARGGIALLGTVKSAALVEV